VRRPLTLVLLALLLGWGGAACSDDGEDADDVSTEEEGGSGGDEDESTTTTDDGGGDDSSTTTTGGDTSTSTSTTADDGTTTTAGSTDTSTDTTAASGDFCTAYDALEQNYADTFAVSQPMVDDLHDLASLVPDEVAADITRIADAFQGLVGLAEEEMFEEMESFEEDPELTAAGDRFDAYVEQTCGAQD
jgi:hypothetical protein